MAKYRGAPNTFKAVKRVEKHNYDWIAIKNT